MRPFLIALLLLLIAPSAHAARVEVTPSVSEAAPGQSFTLTVVLFADETAVNVAEGRILIPEGVHVDAASVAGAAFTLWPSPPSYSPVENAVLFSGGVPGGIAGRTSGTLFTIRARADEAGSYVFSPRAVNAYLDDGSGTPDTVTTSSAVVSVHEGASAPAGVNQAKEPLSAAIGSDPSLFDGKYFVAFYGGDRGNGILRYEVKEGVFGSFVDAGRYYVLEDQSLGRQITIRAIDAEGVAAEKVLAAERGIPAWVFIAGVIFLALALWRLIRRMRSRV